MLFITAVDHWIHRLEEYMLTEVEKFGKPEKARGTQVKLTAEWLILNLFKVESIDIPLPEEMPHESEFFENNDLNERIDFPKYKMQYEQTEIQFRLKWRDLILGSTEELRKKMNEFFNPQNTSITLTKFKLLLVFRLQQQCVQLRKEAYDRLIKIDLEQTMARAAAEVTAKKQAEIEALEATLTKKQAEVKVIRERTETAVKAAKEAKEKAEAAEKASRGSKNTKKLEESAAKDMPEAAEQSAKEKAEAAAKVAKEMTEVLTKEEAQAEILAQEIAKAKTSAGLGTEKENKKQEEEPVLEEAEMIAEDSSAEGDEGEEEEEPEAEVVSGENPSVRIVIAELKRAHISSTVSEVERKSKEMPRPISSDEVLLSAIVEKIIEVTDLMTLLSGKATVGISSQIGITPSAGKTGDVFSCFRDTIKEIFGFFTEADLQSNLSPGAEQAFIDCSPAKIRKRNDPLLIAYENMVPYLLSNYGRLSHNNHSRFEVSWTDSLVSALVTNPLTTFQKSVDYLTYDAKLAKQKRTFLLKTISVLRSSVKGTSLYVENNKVNEGPWQNVDGALEREQKHAGEIKNSWSNRPQEFLQFYQTTRERLQSSKIKLIELKRAQDLAKAQARARKTVRKGSAPVEST